VKRTVQGRVAWVKGEFAAIAGHLPAGLYDSLHATEGVCAATGTRSRSPGPAVVEGGSSVVGTRSTWFGSVQMAAPLMVLDVE
jgi:hypothetical protein